MPLFTDGPVASLADLREYESGILSLASSEGIDLAAKLRIAQRELGSQLETFLSFKGFGQVRRDLSCIAVTEPLLHAHALRALEITYRDLYQSQVNDRFEGKWKEYGRLADQALYQLLRCGIGIVFNPVGAPDVPMVESVPGGLLPARTLHIRTAVVDSNGRASALGPAEASLLDPGTRARVSLRRRDSHSSQGWLVYAGTSDDTCELQTASPLPLTQAWTEPLTGLTANRTGWPTQTPDVFVKDDHQILRG